MEIRPIENAVILLDDNRRDQPSGVVPHALTRIGSNYLVDYAVSEARDVGIEKIYVICDAAERPLLQQHLGNGSIHVVEKRDPHLGILGIGPLFTDPFAMIMANDLILSPSYNPLMSLNAAYQLHGGNVVGTMEVSPEHIPQSIITTPGDRLGRSMEKLERMIFNAAAGSRNTTAAVGRYIVQPDFLGKLAQTEQSVTDRNPFALTFNAMVKHGNSVILRHLEGKHFDCRFYDGFLMANVALAANNPKMADKMRHLLSTGGAPATPARSGQLPRAP